MNYIKLSAILFCCLLPVSVFAVKLAPNFPNHSPLQPMPSGVVPNISNNINSQNTNPVIQGESSANTVNVVNPPVQGQEPVVPPGQHSGVYYAFVLGVLIIFTGGLIWLVLRKKEK